MYFINVITRVGITIHDEKCNANWIKHWRHLVLLVPNHQKSTMEKYYFISSTTYDSKCQSEYDTCTASYLKKKRLKLGVILCSVIVIVLRKISIVLCKIRFYWLIEENAVSSQLIGLMNDMDKNVRILSITQEKFRQGENVVSVGLIFVFIFVTLNVVCLVIIS